MVRFGPFTSDGCRVNAKDTYDDDLDSGRRPRYGVSTFATFVEDGAEVDDAIAHICKTAPCGGRKVARVWSDDLERLGFSVHNDEPPPMHYLVGAGDLAALPDFDALAIIWASNKVGNPAFGKR